MYYKYTYKDKELEFLQFWASTGEIDSTIRYRCFVPPQLRNYHEQEKFMEKRIPYLN